MRHTYESILWDYFNKVASVSSMSSKAKPRTLREFEEMLKECIQSRTISEVRKL